MLVLKAVRLENIFVETAMLTYPLLMEIICSFFREHVL